MTLLAAYNFDEASGDFMDVTGGGHTIPIGSNAARAAGHTGNALTKIATGLPVLAEPAIGQTAHRTLMFWLRGTGGTWWVRWASDALGSGAWGILNLSGFVCVQARDTSGALLTPRPQVAIPVDDAWHHYAATYDGTTVRLYLDAVQVSSGALAGGLYATADRVDLAEWSTAATFLDDLRIYDEELDQPAIATLMDTPVTAGSETGSGSVALPAAAALTLAGVSQRFGTVTLSATGALALAGRKSAAGAAGLAAAGNVAPAGVHSGASQAQLAAAAGLTATGTSTRSGTVTLSAAVSLAAGVPVDEHDITLTAVLAEQPAPAVSLGARRWTAVLGEQS